MDLLKILCSAFAFIVGIVWLLFPFLLLSALKKLQAEIQQTNYHLHAQRALLEQQCNALNSMRADYETPPPPASSRAR